MIFRYDTPMERQISNRRIFQVFFLITVVVGFLFLRQYLSLIILSVLTVLFFNPMYRFFLRKFHGKKSIATNITIFCTMLTFVIPVLMVTGITVAQINTVVSDVRILTEEGEGNIIDNLLDSAVERGNNVLEQVNVSEYRLKRDKLNEYLTTGLRNLGNYLLNFIANLTATVPGFITNFIIYLFLLYYIFPNQEKILDFFKKLSPLDSKVNNLFIENAAEMSKSMVMGTFVVAFVQGLIGALSLYFVGIPYTLFFVVILTFLSIIPLGGGIITIPIGVIMILSGNFWGGLIVLGVHFLIVTNIDNVLRPRLVSDKIEMPGVLVLISIFAGISMFGFFGIVFGPVLMIIIYSSAKIYVNEYNIKNDSNNRRILNRV